MKTILGNGWLSVTKRSNKNQTYFHFHAVEDPAKWSAAERNLVQYFQSAHEDAVERLQSICSPSLHPAAAKHIRNPANNYPHGLPDITLQGYFGEIIAGWFAEHSQPSNLSTWKVPAFLFRYHLTAFQFLERRIQNSRVPKIIVGRTGDDCLAFIRDSSNTITNVLFMEAKCTKSHDATLISNAHDNAANGSFGDITRLIEVLSQRRDKESRKWKLALEEFFCRIVEKNTSSVTRHDLVCYVHSTKPKRKQTWIPTSSPHRAYKKKRILTAVEIRLNKVSRIISDIYKRSNWA